MIRYRVLKCVNHPAGAFCFYGPTFRQRWMAEVAIWLYGFFPDIHGYHAQIKTIGIIPRSER